MISDLRNLKLLFRNHLSSGACRDDNFGSNFIIFKSLCTIIWLVCSFFFRRNCYRSRIKTLGTLLGFKIIIFFRKIFVGCMKQILTCPNPYFWTIIFVVLLHKSIIASALGISAFRVFLRFKDAFNVMLIFGLASPIGVLCGGALRELLGWIRKQNILNN